MKLNGVEFRERVLKSELITEDFPNGFGMELRPESDQPLHLEELVKSDCQQIIEMTRIWGGFGAEKYRYFGSRIDKFFAYAGSQ